MTPMSPAANKRSQGDDFALASDDDIEGPSVYGSDQYAVSVSVKPAQAPAFGRVRRQSFSEDEDDPLQVDTPVQEPEQKKESPITWMSLPRKGQLAILVMARLSEPLVQSSLRVGQVIIVITFGCAF
jgi:hypothetical protein